VTGQSDVDFWIILEHPTGASITMDKRVESGLYPNNRLGEYLEAITPAREKALFDVATISMVIGNHLGKPWLTLVEPRWCSVRISNIGGRRSTRQRTFTSFGISTRKR
jgi:hypothetical protein